jgi:hypothetical protein
MALYTVTLQHRFIFQRFFAMKSMAALDVSGVLDRQSFKEAYPEINAIRPGASLYIPQFNKAAAFSRIDITSSADATFTRVSSSDQVFPVLRDTSDNYYTRYDVKLNGEKQRVALETTIAERMAERMLKQTSRVLSGALPTATPTHVYDKTGSALSTVDLIGAKALLEDQFYKLDTLVCHPNVYNDILGEWVTKLKYNVLTGVVALSGELQNIIGVKYIIPTNQTLVTAAGATCSGDDVYESYLLGSNALFFGFQNENDVENPIIEYMDNYIVKAVTQNLIRFNLDYLVAPRGFGWTGASNPTDANLIDSQYWAMKTEDHRNILAVKILSAGFGGKTATM